MIGGAFGLLLIVILLFGPHLRREFFPEVDSGAFEMTVRLPSGTRIEVTEGYIEAVEKYVKSQLGDDLELAISELGLTADWSAAYTPNAGPMDAVVKVQLKPERHRSAQQAVALLRQGFQEDPAFEKLLTEAYARKVANQEIPASVEAFNRFNMEFSFDAGGLIRSAMNEGKSTPINIKVTGKKLVKTRAVAEKILTEMRKIEGVADVRIVQRLDYPQYMIDVDRAKAAALGLNQAEVMRNIVGEHMTILLAHQNGLRIDRAEGFLPAHPVAVLENAEAVRSEFASVVSAGVLIRPRPENRVTDRLSHVANTHCQIYLRLLIDLYLDPRYFLPLKTLHFDGEGVIPDWKVLKRVTAILVARRRVSQIGRALSDGQ